MYILLISLQKGEILPSLHHYSEEDDIRLEIILRGICALLLSRTADFQNQNKLESGEKQ